MKAMHSFKLCVRIILGIVALLTLLNESSSADVPTNVNERLQKHELSLQQTTLVWRIDVDEQRVAMPLDDAASLRKQLEKSYAASFRKAGMRDETQIQKLVQEDMSGFTKAMNQTAFHYADSWEFAHDNQSVLVSGAIQYNSKIPYYFHQFYSGENALVVEDLPADQTRLMSPPVAWRTSGESIRNFSPVVQGLNLSPEHLALLIGLNPMAMHGAQWQLSSATPDNWILKTKVAHANSTVDVQMTLDRKHDNLPSEIKMMTDQTSETFSAESFRRYQNDWICDKVVYQKSVPGHISVTQHWVLQSLEPTKPLVVKVPSGNRVHDYRLMGQDLNWQDMQNEDAHGNKPLVYYSWPGQFPSLDELKQLYQKRHPGEATPDPQASSSLPVVGGLLCLVGGVWMFKRRGVS
jgi:hypothetical protein